MNLALVGEFYVIQCVTCMYLRSCVRLFVLTLYNLQVYFAHDNLRHPVQLLGQSLFPSHSTAFVALVSREDYRHYLAGARPFLALRLS